MTELKIIDQTPHIAKHVLGDCAFNSEVYLMDCMELMAKYPENYFDLAVVDPPYGLGNRLVDGGGTRKAKFDNDRNSIKWDNKPNYKYFEELKRVSKNQIVWGGNYLIRPMIIADFEIESSCWLIWDKIQEFTGSDFEMAWTSFDKASKAFRMSRVEAYSQGKIHPTQKPTALYDWIFNKYATEGMKVLDTHLGSGSSRISANKANLHFVGCEIDEEYFNKSCKRYDDFISQVRLF